MCWCLKQVLLEICTNMSFDILLWVKFTYHFEQLILTHWGRVTDIWVSKLTIIGSDNCLLPERRQANIWINAGILLIWTLGTHFSEILSEIDTFSFKKMHFKTSSAKRRPFCLSLNVLTPKWLDHVFCYVIDPLLNQSVRIGVLVSIVDADGLLCSIQLVHHSIISHNAVQKYVICNLVSYCLGYKEV